jgi:hypothetical protein
MSKKTNLVVHLKWIKGARKSFDENGVLQNENGITKLRYGTLEWRNYLKRLRTHGFCDVTAVKMFEDTRSSEDRYKEVDVLEEIALEVTDAIQIEKPVLSKEEQRIAKLEAQIEALTKASEPKKKEVKEVVAEKEKPAQAKRGRKPKKED